MIISRLGKKHHDSYMWRYIGRSTEPMPQVNEDDTSDLDPLTGCKPVTVAPQARQRPSS